MRIQGVLLDMFCGFVANIARSGTSLTAINAGFAARRRMPAGSDMSRPAMKRVCGFTLIELMIVVAIVGILAAIAYPSYQRQVQNTRRAAAEGCLLELGQWMERYYTTNMTYVVGALPATGCQTELANSYIFAFAAGEPTAATFSIDATPQNAQASDTCGALSLDHLGTKSPTTAGCWVK